MREMRAAVIGVGDRQRHDAAVGPEVIDRLAKLRLRDVALAVADGEPAKLVDLWSDADIGVLVNAVRNEPCHPGKIHELIADGPLTTRCRSVASPDLDLDEVIEVAVALGHTPRRLVVLAVEGCDFSPGVGLTPAVAAAIDRVVGLAMHEVALTHPRV